MDADAWSADNAERAWCSETAARTALEQLSEMGIADRRNGRPARDRRNESYVRWQRVESLAREHSATELQELRSDRVDPQELVIRKRASKKLEEYSQTTQTVAALERYQEYDVEKAPGEDVQYIVVVSVP